MSKILMHYRQALFMWAVRHGHLRIVKFLANFMKVRDVTADDNLAFYDAALYGQLEVVKFLINIPGVDIYLQQTLEDVKARAEYFPTFGLDMSMKLKSVIEFLQMYSKYSAKRLDAHFKKDALLNVNPDKVRIFSKL